MLRLATCEAEKTFTKEVQSGPEEVEDCTKVARWIGSLKIKNCEKVWKFEWLQYPTGHLSVCRLRLKKSLVPVADCCQGPLNMWKNLWVWNKNVNLLILSHDRWVEQLFCHPGRQHKLFSDDGWTCGECLSIRCREQDCPQSLENFIITVGDLVPSQGCDRSNPIRHLGLSVRNWSKPFSTDLDLV